ncbi:MAG: 30S ribosomal protein S17 [Patescibacteria group bacterium]|jgi:small subunit ribosomal protein S17
MNTIPTEKKRMMRTLSGVAVHDAKDKTVSVRVTRTRINTKYGKRYTVSRLYPVHDEVNQSKAGDAISFIECRPLSKRKRWRIAASATRKA